jgi:hypothetical protein
LHPENDKRQIDKIKTTMKKILNLMMAVMMMAAMTVAAVGCSDGDDENGGWHSVAGDIADDYAGVMNMSLPAQPGIVISPFDAAVKIAAQSDGTATLTLPGATYNMGGKDMVISGFELRNVNVTLSGSGVYTVGPAVIDCEVSGMEYKGVLNGAVTDGKLTLAYSLKVGKMPFDLVFKFTGDK